MMRQQTKAWLQWLAATMLATVLGWVTAVAAAEEPLTLVVMDPLAAPLSCPCVAGYAQRDYEQLADFLTDAVGCPVQVVFTESLHNDGKPVGQVDLVIGKRSVVEADGQMLEAAGGPALTPVASLTDREGSPWQQGLVVVARDDPAHSLANLQTHTILLGPADSAEKHAAVRQLFAVHGRTLAADTGCSAACSDGAAAVIEAAEAGAAPVAAVISSYAQPLLEGCGTIKRGDLRVVGRTANVPFITAFLSTGLPAERREILTKALFRVGGDPLLRLALETKQGFVPLVAPLAGDAVTPAATDQSQLVVPMPATNPDWPGWRGRQRDGRVAWLPETLPARADQRWKATLFSEGVGGVAVAEGVVVVGDRDLTDERDVFHAFDAATGERLWMVDYPAAGRLDYGNSPRATPCIEDGLVYLLGAFGHLHCCRLRTGDVVWNRHIRDEFGAVDELVWGVASSPLLVDERLIVNPGGPAAAVVALHPDTGATLWQTPGAPAGFASFVFATLRDRPQCIGFDKVSCGGWDPVTGTRLWTYTPKVAGDFNVPTPLVLNQHLMLVSENNGARLLDCSADQPVVRAHVASLRPDMHTPVMTAGRIFAVHEGRVFCLDAATLKPVWSVFDRSLKGHVSLIAADDRVLLQTQQGELVLIDARADTLQIVSRSLPFRREVSTYAHPAVAGDAIFVRGPGKLICLPLAGSVTSEEGA